MTHGEEDNCLHGVTDCTHRQLVGLVEIAEVGTDSRTAQRSGTRCPKVYEVIETKLS